MSEKSLREALADSLEKQMSSDVVEEAPKEELAASSDEQEVVEESHEENNEDISEAVEEEIEAPSHWAPEDREIFKALDAKGRQFLIKEQKSMKADYTKKMQALSEERKIAESFKKSVTPYENYLKQLNIDPTQAFEKLIAAEMRLRMANPHEKGAILHDLAKQYGANFDPQAPQIQAPQLDEKTQLIYDELHKQRAYLMNLEQDRQKQEEKALENTINSFSSTKEKDGSLKYPHFEEVRRNMGALINAGTADSLEDAYEKAVLLDKNLRKEYLNRYTKNDEARHKAVASKKAGFNVKSGSTSQIIDASPKLSLRETLARAMDTSQRV